MGFTQVVGSEFETAYRRGATARRGVHRPFVNLNRLPVAAD